MPPGSIDSRGSPLMFLSLAGLAWAAALGFGALLEHDPFRLKHSRH